MFILHFKLGFPATLLTTNVVLQARHNQPHSLRNEVGRTDL